MGELKYFIKIVLNSKELITSFFYQKNDRRKCVKDE